MRVELYGIGDVGLSLGGPNPGGFSSLVADAGLAASLQKQSRLKFQGFRYCEVYGTAISADGQRTKWCRDDDIIRDMKTLGFDDETIQLMLGRT